MVQELRRSTAHAYSYAEYTEKMSQADWSDDERRSKLTLRLSDLESTDAFRLSQDASQDKRAAWMLRTTLGELVDADGRLEPMARLMHALGCHAFVTARSGRRFVSAAAALSAAADQHDGGLGFGADDEEAAAIINLLEQSAVPPELRVLPSHAARLRAVKQEVATPRNDPGLGRLLAERIATAVTLHAPLRALLGVDPSGTAAAVGVARAVEMLRDVAVRGQVVSAAEPFGPSALRRLATAAAYLADVLASPPLSKQPPSARAEHVVAALAAARTSTAAAAAAASSAHVIGCGAGEALGTVEREVAAGSKGIPAHYREALPAARNTTAYRALRAAIMLRLGQSDSDAQLDALQFASTGILIDARTQLPKPRRWVPLVAFMAMGTDKAVQADLVDPDMVELGEATRTLWPQLLGRTVGRMVSSDKMSLHHNRGGWELVDMAAVLGSADWSTLDLGGAFRAARSAMAACRGPSSSDEAATAGSEPYASESDLADALEVAAPIATLMGYPGSGEGTLPHALSQVRQTWRTYGSEAATRKVQRQLAEKGRANIVACLKALGKARWSVLTTRSPNALQYPYALPRSAVAAFDRHVGFREGALTVQGYLEYARAAGGDSDDEHTPPRASKGKHSVSGAGEQGARDAAKELPKAGARVLKIAVNGRVVDVTLRGQQRLYYSVKVVKELAAAGERACVLGVVASSLQRDELHLVCKHYGKAEHESYASDMHVWARPGKNLQACRCDEQGELLRTQFQQPVVKRKLQHVTLDVTADAFATGSAALVSS